MFPSSCSKLVDKGVGQPVQTLKLVDGLSTDLLQIIRFSRVQCMEFLGQVYTRISVASNAIQTIGNEVSHPIIFYLNYIRCDRNSTSKPGLMWLASFFIFGALFY